MRTEPSAKHPLRRALGATLALALALACGGLPDTGEEAMRAVEAEALAGRWCREDAPTCYVFTGNDVVREEPDGGVEGRWRLEDGQILALFPEGDWIARVERVDGARLVVYDLREGATVTLTREDAPRPAAQVAPPG